MHAVAIGLAALAGVLASGCASSELTEPEPALDVAEVIAFPVGWVPKLDVLLVVDDSPRSARGHAHIAATLAELGSALVTFDAWGTVPVDLHLGVVTTDAGCGAGPDDVGDDGRLQAMRHLVGHDATGAQYDLGVEACPLRGDDAFIRNVGAPDGARLTNVSGSLDEAIACLAAVGVDGCEFDQPLEAMQRALTHARAGTGNARFRRDDAYLVVIFITDEDDCSALTPRLFDEADAALGVRDTFRCFEYGVTCDAPARDPDVEVGPSPATVMTGCLSNDLPSGPLAPVQPYVLALRQLEADQRGPWVIAVVGRRDEIAVERQGAGAPHPGWYTLAPSFWPRLEPREVMSTPAVRLGAFTDAFEVSDTLGFGEGELPDYIRGRLNGFGPARGRPCLDQAPVDIDPDADGLQPDCAFTIDHREGGAARTLPPCGDGNSAAPCWRLESEPECGWPVQLAVDVDWGGAVPLHQVVRGQCAVTSES